MDSIQAIININNLVKGTMIEHLGIKFTQLGDNFIEATMPVDERTINPAQILHGGAMMALAETVGSALSLMLIDREKQDIRGIEINGNHVKSARNGLVLARASIVHMGKLTHVSEIKIFDAEKKLLNTSRMTNMIVDRE